MQPDEKGHRQRRSTEGPMKKPALKVDDLRRRSTGDLRGMHSSLRVKSQFDSLRKRWLKDSIQEKHTNRVAFSYLEVREFPIILGDNPSCMEGPPITIDWSHDPKTQFILDVNTFERMRGCRRRGRELSLSKAARETKLTNCGISTKEMAAAVRQVRKEKHYRMVSSQQTNLDPMHEVMENAATGIKKMFSFKKSQYVKTLEAASSQRPPHHLTSSDMFMNHALSA